MEQVASECIAPDTEYHFYHKAELLLKNFP